MIDKPAIYCPVPDYEYKMTAGAMAYSAGKRMYQQALLGGDVGKATEGAAKDVGKATEGAAKDIGKGSKKVIKKMKFW